MPLPKTEGHISYGGALRPGEGDAIAQFVQQGKRIPRRGEVGLSADEISRVENYNLTRPSASLSSFAEADGDESSGKIHALNEHQENEKPQEDLQGMAQAFNISSSTATAISICIPLAALCFPYFMNSLGQGMTLKTKLLSYGTLLFGFYMAWNIGANDVANAMGTSVGSGALTLRQAVLTAAVLEFSGALYIDGKTCLLSSLAAAGTWLQFVYSAPNPGQAAAAAAPIAVFIRVTGISFVAFPLSKILSVAIVQALALGTVGAFLFDRIIRKQLGHLLVKSSSTQSDPKEDSINQKNVGFLAEVAGPTGTQLEIV
ncbi:hypothetical protein POM88_031758 [Heracleum sosnowskyi]|uniref:NF-kappa-B-activating protein C-terminal domain-containing protein n=1 Tax=Heracleum sosnowskyi TaxID=360622 RepID=A0AAD8I0X6_9APIA|nr:hypothetical protein POM88_031758 [Heracleum sosnowskyi]